MMRSLVVQLSAQNDEVSTSLKELYLRSRDGTHSPLLDELSDCLQSMIGSASTTYLIIDGLDEANDTFSSLTLVCNMLQNSLGKLKLLCLSRSNRDIESTMHDRGAAQIALRRRYTEVDIQAFIQHHLDHDPRFKRWSTGIRQEIEKSLIEKANGM